MLSSITLYWSFEDHHDHDSDDDDHLWETMMMMMMMMITMIMITCEDHHDDDDDDNHLWGRAKQQTLAQYWPACQWSYDDGDDDDDDCDDDADGDDVNDDDVNDDGYNDDDRIQCWPTCMCSSPHPPASPGKKIKREIFRIGAAMTPTNTSHTTSRHLPNILQTFQTPSRYT